MDEELISLEKMVVLQKGKVYKAVKVIEKKNIVFEKLRFKLDNAVGWKYGTTFKVCGGELVVANTYFQAAQEDAKTISGVLTSGTDNRSIIDTHGDSQRLKRESIIQLREKGASGEEIIQKLVTNSSSFSDKTVFSQSKYLKKKQQKHFAYIQILKPTARLICKLYQDREPAKICHMHVNGMAQLITYTDIKQGANVVVMETCSGVLLGMILERLGGNGEIVNLHVGETPSNLFGVSLFNFPKAYWDQINSLPLNKVGPLLTGKTLLDTTIAVENASLSDSSPETNCGLPAVECPLKRKRSDEDMEKMAIRLARRQKRLSQQQKGWDLLQMKKMDALIVACRFHPTPVVLMLLEVLSFSKPFAIYCEYKEPLMELFVHLSVKGNAINLQLSESFCRGIQVLPERTHPHVMMNAGGGYLLTGTKVQPTFSQEICANIEK